MLGTARTGEMSNCMLSCAVAICEVALEIVAGDADRLSGSRQALLKRPFSCNALCLYATYRGSASILTLLLQFKAPLLLQMNCWQQGSCEGQRSMVGTAIGTRTVLAFEL